MTPRRRDATTGRRPTGGRLRDVAHADPDLVPGTRRWFARGPPLATDGGEPADRATPDRTTPDRAADEADEAARDVEDERLRDVSHEPPHGEGANRVWERGDDERVS